MITALNIAGTRPNFMKIAPVHRAMTQSSEIRSVLVHTGQHYDDNMSQVFFDEFGLPEPEFELGVGSGSHAQQTARILENIEPIMVEVRPDVVIVYGDVNSTIATAIAAAKLHIPIAHVEAGLRSFDRTMPEEINRLLTDCISDLLFAPSQDGVDNLIREGVSPEKIFLVGNVMIDTLRAFTRSAANLGVVEAFGLDPGGYVLVTLHRPSNVDAESELTNTAALLSDVAQLAPTILVAHPRTASRLESFGLIQTLSQAGVRVSPPLGYVPFLSMMTNAGVVLTDSGGIQEETTVLGIPCVTMRTTTERPITISHGTNVLAGTDRQTVLEAVRSGLTAERNPSQPPLWDGLASQRIVRILIEKLNQSPAN
ncbi:MAG TPA: UDP-N-acetylglucosamine 2-epimerase (non-hydrolyzing) [Actinomycetota bacterium]|nr:UDP-N-acetylglucosamine 2-epimerase (non-hydrolyzing) [Actinomycetota bacterium]